jgi:hypothetical protein
LGGRVIEESPLTPKGGQRVVFETLRKMNNRNYYETKVTNIPFSGLGWKREEAAPKGDFKSGFRDDDKKNRRQY